jgi:hypothetical protein
MEADAKAMTDAKTKAAEGWIAAQVKATAASREAAAAETARVAKNQAEIDQQMAGFQRLADGNKQVEGAAKSSTDAAIFGFAGVTQAIEISAEALREWMNLMRFTNAANAINQGGSSLFQTQSQRERLASLPVPSFATGVTDFGGGLAKVHRDELLVNLPAGTDVIPSSGGGGGPRGVSIGDVHVHGSVLSTPAELREMISAALVDVFRSGAVPFPA